MSTIVTIGAIGVAVAIGTIVLPTYHLFPKVVIGANVSTVAIGIIFAIGTIVAIETIVAIGNSVLPAYHHRFLHIIIVTIGANVAIVAIGIIFTIVAIGVIVAIGTIV